MANNLHQEIRERYISTVTDFLTKNGDEVLRTFKVPTGSRDGEPYDGYGVAESYKLKCKEKVEKAKKSAELKAKKIAKDKAIREKRKNIKKKEG